MCGASPIEETVNAAMPGVATTNQRFDARSAQAPTKGWTMLGICWPGTIKLATKSETPSFSCTAGISGPRNDE